MRPSSWPSCLVLAAGLGLRLDPITRLVAKPAVPLAGRTLVERVLAWLHAEGVRHVVMNLHHRPETIAAVLGDGAHLGLRVRYSWERAVLGSAGGPRRALPLVGTDPFLIVNGDTLSNVALSPMREAFERTGADVLLAVVPNPAPAHYNGIATDPELRVTGFVPRGPTAAGTWHFIGVQIARPSVFAPLPDGVPAETIAGIYRDIVADRPGRIRAWPVETPFLDVGTPADYLDAALTLAGHAGGSAVEAGALVDSSARISRTVVWPAARIGACVRLDECIVAGPVAVPDGFTAARQVIVPASIVRAGDAAEIVEGMACFPIERQHGDTEDTGARRKTPNLSGS